MKHPLARWLRSGWLAGLCLLPALAAAAAVPIEVYLIGGQSNATGQGYVKDLPAGFVPNPAVLLFHSGAPHLRSTGPAGSWQPLQPASESPDRYGLELSFGNRLQELRPAHRIALIKHAHSGTNLYAQWAPGANASDRARWGGQFMVFVATVDAGLQALRDQGFAPVVAGMLWQQGEADADKGGAEAAAYATNLAHFIRRVREQFNAPSLRFVYGRIFALSDRGPGRTVVRQAQTDIAEDSGSPRAVAGASLVQTDDLTRRADNPGTAYPRDREHISSAGLLELGRRMAEAVNDRPPPKSSP